MGFRMRIGLISDAHGNPISLRACLTQIDSLKLDAVYFLGDAVGYFPGEAEVIEQLLQRSILCQKGNHEAMLLGDLTVSSDKESVHRLTEARQRLAPSGLRTIREWPDHRVIYLGGRKVLLAHGSPFDFLREYVLPDSDLSSFSTLDYDAVFLGHTHRPFVRTVGTMLVSNVGSCGLPRDRGDLASFAVYDADSNACEILRVPFSKKELLRHFAEADIAESVRSCLERRTADYVGRTL